MRNEPKPCISVVDVVVNAVVSIQECVTEQPVGILGRNKGEEAESLTAFSVLDEVVLRQNLHPRPSHPQVKVLILIFLATVYNDQPCRDVLSKNLFVNQPRNNLLSNLSRSVNQRSSSVENGRERVIAEFVLLSEPGVGEAVVIVTNLHSIDGFSVPEHHILRHVQPEDSILVSVLDGRGVVISNIDKGLSGEVSNIE